jgi:hypothetical protein
MSKDCRSSESHHLAPEQRIQPGQFLSIQAPKFGSDRRARGLYIMLPIRGNCWQDLCSVHHPRKHQQKLGNARRMAAGGSLQKAASDPGALLY